MLKRHPTPEEISELLDPMVAPAQAEWVVDHLFRCGECWNLATETIVSLDGGSMSRPASASLRALVERFRLEQARLEKGLEALAAIGNLRGLNRKGRRELLVKRVTYRSREVIEELLGESRRADAPQEGEEWATLALTTCHQLPEDYSESLRSDLLAQAYSELASARRRSARWNAAREALREGYEHARRGSRSGAIEGYLLTVEGAIEGDIGHLQAADDLIQRARICFSASSETRLDAKALVQLAYIWMEAEPLRSLNYLREVAPLIPPSDKRLFLLAESTRIDCLLTLGAIREALRRFSGLAELWDQFSDPFFQLRRRFMAGRILEGFRRFSEADAIFREVVAADLEQRSAKSLFLDLIYMFGSYVRRGDLSRAIDVCREALEQISILDLDEASEQQMKGLWASLRRYAQKGAVGLDVIEKSRRFIRSQWKTAGGDALATKESAV
jgi:tetratricopeptide (TPR) repeat protein